MAGLTMRKFRDIILDGDRVQKGTLLSSAGGVLPPAAFTEFYQRIQTGKAVFNAVTQHTLTRPQQELHHLTMAGRQMRAANPGTAISSGTMTPIERTLDPTAALVVLDVSYDWINDNADERDADQVIRDYLADYVQGEILDIMGNGDGTTASFLSINKGFPNLLAGDSNSDVKFYDATNTTMLGASGILAKTRDAQTDDQYRDGGQFIMSKTEFDQFIDELGARATLLGDTILKAGGPVDWQGYTVIGAPKWPNDKIVFAPKWNLHMGLWHHVKITARDIEESDIVRYVVRTRFDLNYANGAAAVLSTTD